MTQVHTLNDQYYDELNRCKFDILDINVAKNHLKNLEKEGKVSKYNLLLSSLKDNFKEAGMVEEYRELKSLSYCKAIDHIHKKELITEEHQKYIIKNRLKSTIHLIMYTILLTGIRTSEVSYLEWSNIKETEEGYKYINLLEGRGNRVVYIKLELYNSLKTFYKDSIRNGYIFTNTFGGSLNRQTICTYMREFNSNLNSNYTLTNARDTFVYNVILNNYDKHYLEIVNKISSLIGDCHIRYTINRYRELIEDVYKDVQL